MNRWLTFLDSLNTPGGHIFIFLAMLMCTGITALVLALKGSALAMGLGGFIAGTLIPALFTACRGTDKANGRPAGSLTRSTDPADPRDARSRERSSDV